jgi:hypothetical protein
MGIWATHGHSGHPQIDLDLQALPVQQRLIGKRLLDWLFTVEAAGRRVDSDRFQPDVGYSIAGPADASDDDLGEIMKTNAHDGKWSRPVLSARVAALMVVLSAGLTESCGPATEARSPVDGAAFLERTRCGPEVTDGSLAPILDGKALQKVGPLYSTVEADKSGEQSQLRGATLTVSALPGVTAEWLDRELECHGARLALGKATSTPEDPFWLPGSTVDIDVRPTKDGFIIAVAGFSTSDARHILNRAEAFAKAKTAAPAGP